MKTNYYIAWTLFILFLFKLSGADVLSEMHIFSFSCATFILTLSSFINSMNQNRFIMFTRKDMYSIAEKISDWLNFLGIFLFIALPLLLASFESMMTKNIVMLEVNNYMTIISLSLVLISIAFDNKTISNRKEILKNKEMAKQLRMDIDEHKINIEKMKKELDKAIIENNIMKSIIGEERIGNEKRTIGSERALKLMKENRIVLESLKDDK